MPLGEKYIRRRSTDLVVTVNRGIIVDQVAAFLLSLRGTIPEKSEIKDMEFLAPEGELIPIRIILTKKEVYKKK